MSITLACVIPALSPGKQGQQAQEFGFLGQALLRPSQRQSFFQKGLGAITGPNEVGKSFIVEAIRFSLFGSAALRGRADDYRKLKAELAFTVKGQAYRAVRNGSSATLFCGTEEIAVGVAYLSGEPPQGRIGIGYAVLKQANATPPANQPELTVLEVDERLSVLASIRGGGSTARRAAALSELFARATHPEQQFIVRLLIGELRQGALAGVMVDAIAAAARTAYSIVDSSPSPAWMPACRSRKTHTSAVCSRSNSLTCRSP